MSRLARSETTPEGTRFEAVTLWSSNILFGSTRFAPY